MVIAELHAAVAVEGVVVLEGLELVGGVFGIVFETEVFGATADGDALVGCSVCWSRKVRLPTGSK